MAKDSNNTLAVLAHVLGVFIGLWGPLIILLAAKDKNVKKHAKNALNWQLSSIIYYIVSFILMIILIGFLLLFAVYIVNIVFSIIAAVKASEGETWKYPLSIPFLKVGDK